MSFPTITHRTHARLPQFQGSPSKAQLKPESPTEGSSSATNPAPVASSSTWTSGKLTSLPSLKNVTSALGSMLKNVKLPQATSSQPPTASADAEAPTLKQTRFEITDRHILPTALNRRIVPTITTSSTMEQQLSDAVETTPEATGENAATPSAPNTPALLGGDFHLPFSKKAFSSTHTSLIADDSGAQSRFAPSRATSRRASILQPPTQHLSREASSAADTTELSDGTSAWMVEDDESVLAERAERHARARSHKAASSAAQSVILEQDDEDDESDHGHYMDGDSQLDDDDYFMYHDGDTDDGTQSDNESTHSAAKSAKRPIEKPKEKDAFAQALETKSPKEIEQMASQPKNSLLTEGLMSPQTRKINDLIASYRQRSAAEQATIGAKAAEAQKQKEKAAVIDLCNTYTLDQIQNGQRTLANSFDRSNQQVYKLLHSLGIAPGENFPELVEKRQQELTAARIKVTTELEKLSHPASSQQGALDPEEFRSKMAELKQTRAALRQQKEAILANETKVEKASERYEQLIIDMEQIRLKLHRCAQAITLKRQRAIISLIEKCEDQQDKRIALSHELANNYPTDELERMLNAFKQKKGTDTEKALTILDKAISFQKVK